MKGYVLIKLYILLQTSPKYASVNPAGVLKEKNRAKRKQKTVKIRPEVFAGFVCLLLLTCTINGLSS